MEEQQAVDASHSCADMSFLPIPHLLPLLGPQAPLPLRMHPYPSHSGSENTVFFLDITIAVHPCHAPLSLRAPGADHRAWGPRQVLIKISVMPLDPTYALFVCVGDFLCPVSLVFGKKVATSLLLAYLLIWWWCG